MQSQQQQDGCAAGNGSAGGGGGGVVRCTAAGAVDGSSNANLRCRFGERADVAGTVLDDRAVGCSPPMDIGSCKDTVTVMDGELTIAEHKFDPEMRMLLQDPDATSDSGLPEEKQKSGLKEKMKREYKALKPFCIISLSYLLFTTTDGAIRMIVLLHAYNNGFTAMEVAIMFTLYELAGVITNLLAGVAGAKWGIKYTLIVGLTLQLGGIGILYGWQDSWGEPGQKWKAVLFVTCAQALCGVAKDLTKLGGKTVTKLITPDEKQTRLFKLVAFITGMKNSMKGVGYFIGSAAVSFNYFFALGLLMFLILLAYPWAVVGLSSDLGRTRKENLTLATIFKQRYNVNVLSVSRFFLFASRDLWFEVPLPFFLRDPVAGLGWSSPVAGLVLALFIIIYGQVQSWSPPLLLQPLRQMPANRYAALLWCGVLVACPLYLGTTIEASDIFYGRDLGGMTAVLLSGLAFFCVVFAVNSSIHSYLIVRYSDGDKVAMNVGFYYMANAMGRLVGTLMSGALYSYVGNTVVAGFAACFFASVAFAFASVVVDFFIRDDAAGLYCGPCLPLVRPPPEKSVGGAAGGGGGMELSAITDAGAEADKVAVAEVKLEMSHEGGVAAKV